MLPTWQIVMLSISFGVMIVMGFVGFSGLINEFLDKEENK